MSRRKRICIFMGEISLSFQRSACEEIKRQGKLRNIDVVLFASCGSYIGPYGRNVFFELGEKNIIHLPDLTTFDGVFVFPDTFDVYGMDTELYDLLKKTVTCPVVSVRNGISDFPIVKIDNKEIFSTMTSHFIKDHGFNNIAFMSGPLDMKDGLSRYEGYVDAMNKAGLEIKPNFFFEGNYWRNKGVEACDRFFDCSVEDRPQAIVCANDYMAQSVIEELVNRGIRVPEDVCVSGFDDIPECSTMSPTLTTVSVKPSSFIIKAFDTLESLWAGEEISVTYVDYEIIFRQSCGCVNVEPKLDIAEVNRQLNYFDNLIRDHSRMVAEYQNSFAFDNTMVVACHYFALFGGEIGYLCICDENDPEYKSVEANKIFSDQMILKRIMFSDRDKSPIAPERRFNRCEVIPQDYLNSDEAQFITVFSIHFRSKAYGYIVITPKDGEWPSLFTTIYLNCLASAIENGYIEAQYLEMEEIKKQYLLDPLTGVYNRRGFEKQMQSVLHLIEIDDTYSISFASIDMDNLKYINDEFGHAEGDFAIQTLVKVVGECIEKTDFCSRMGGDEFSVVLVSKSIERLTKFKEKFEKTLNRKSVESGKPYRIHASIGVCGPEKIQGLNLIESMQIADDKMYENKRKYKKECR